MSNVDQAGNIPNGSAASINASANANLDALKTNAANAYNTVANGPVAENIKDQSAKTGAEFSNLGAARRTPPTPAATGQKLTHYHSFFSELLSWNNPRASAIAYGAIATFIFAVRYLDLIRWGFKLTWMVLGITLAAEVVGKTLLNSGLATQVRPRKYYTVPKETLDAVIGDVNELVNFFVIEAQRILFAENVPASAVTALAAFLAYYLVKIVPYWGLALIATTAIFFTPLIYKTNQEVIDYQIHHASEVIGAQTAQLRETAQKSTAQATEVTKQYMGDYTAKAQQLIGRGRSVSPETHVKLAPKEYKDADFPEPPKDYKTTDFPVPPVDGFKGHEEPVVKTEGPILT